MDEVPPSFTQETYTQYVNLDDDFEITGVHDDVHICEEVVQNNQVENDDANEENSADATVVIPPISKKVLHALDIIRRRL